MKAPQIIMIVYISLELGIALVKDGKTRKTSFIGTLVGAFLMVWLLIAGGFFQ